MADGIVLRAEDKWEDNARPGDRTLLRGSIIEHGTAQAVSIAGNDEDARIFTAVTDAQKRMQLRCFDPSAGHLPKPGDNDWFTEVVDQGFYFEPYAVHPAVDGAAVPTVDGDRAGAAARVTARS